jgi:capsular polysaccharide biosynthesis protein
MIQVSNTTSRWKQSGMVTEQTTPTAGGTLSPAGILRVLSRRLWTIVLVAVVLAGSALGFSLVQKPTYEASIKVLVGQKIRGDQSFAGNVAGLQQFTPTMAKAVTTLPVAQGVVEELGMPERTAEELLANLSAQTDPGTTFIDISYSDTDPEKAQRVANTVGEVFSGKISEISPGVNAVTATVYEPATLPETPVSPRPVRNVILALVLGGFLGVGLAFLLEYLDDSWSAPEEVEQVTGVPTFGVIPKFQVLTGKKKREVLANQGKGRS